MGQILSSSSFVVGIASPSFVRPSYPMSEFRAGLFIAAPIIRLSVLGRIFFVTRMTALQRVSLSLPARALIISHLFSNTISYNISYFISFHISYNFSYVSSNIFS